MWGEKKKGSKNAAHNGNALERFFPSLLSRSDAFVACKVHNFPSPLRFESQQ
jgi:hypothetical protein